jgi:hypothetical protein
MKTKIFPYIFIALIYAFPFRYAILDPTSSNTVNLLCMVATVFGTLIFMGLTFTNGSEDDKKQITKDTGRVSLTEKKAA